MRPRWRVRVEGVQRVRGLKNAEWVETQELAPPVDRQSEAGIACVTCGVVLFPDTRFEIECILQGHADHNEVYMVTKEKNGDIVRRGRIRKSH
jgi:hypothetical protein